MTPTPHPDEQSHAPGFLVGGGRFTLVRVLGRGGMGMVWLARDEQLHEDVALKFLPPEIRHDPVALDDLRRETARSRKLTHANIIRIHDFYRNEDEAFISMEYVDGPNMSDLRLEQQDRVFAWTFLEPLVKQLCEALEYAHSEKVVHRDLKPANMMLDSRGRLKLADFGIAAAVSDSATRISMIRHAQSGTSTYMSPQQMDGRLPQVTDDIYALGATLYELLTSRPPFFTGDVPHQVRNLAPQPISERLDEQGIHNPVPLPVAAMIMACLGKDPAQRPQSARAVAEWIGLQATKVSEPPSIVTTAKAVVAPGVPAPEPKKTTDVTTGKRVLAPQPESAFVEVHESEPEPTHITTGLAETPSRKRRMLLVGALALVVTASAAWWVYRQLAPAGSRAAAVGGSSATAAVPEEDFNASTVSEEPTKIERTLTGHAAPVNSVATSRDGSVVVSGSSDATAVVWDVRSGTARGTLKGHGQRINAVALTADGRLAATASDDKTVRLWDVAAESTRHVLIGHGAEVTTVAFAPASNLIASGDNAGQICIWNAESGARLRTIRGHSGRVTALAFRDSGVLASAGTDRGFRTWNVDTGTASQKSARTAMVNALAFSPDGQLLAVACADGVLRFWDAIKWEQRRIHKLGSQVLLGLAYSPDSRFIAYSTDSSTVVVWELNGTRRRSWKVFRGHVGAVASVALTPSEVVSGGADKFVKLSRYRDAAPENEAARPVAEDGFVPLFNGRDLAGWSGDPEVWSVVNGVIRGELMTKGDTTCLLWHGGTIENFEVRFSYRLLRAGNSGVIYRAREFPDFMAGGYQFEIMRGNIGNLLDVGPDRKRRDLHRLNNAYSGGADWHEGVIRAEGGKVTHMDNGVELFSFYDTAPEAPKSGIIGFEAFTAPTVVEFKDVRLRRLPAP